MKYPNKKFKGVLVKIYYTNRLYYNNISLCTSTIDIQYYLEDDQLGLIWSS